MVSFSAPVFVWYFFVLFKQTLVHVDLAFKTETLFDSFIHLFLKILQASLRDTLRLLLIIVLFILWVWREDLDLGGLDLLQVLQVQMFLTRFWYMLLFLYWCWWFLLLHLLSLFLQILLWNISIQLWFILWTQNSIDTTDFPPQLLLCSRTCFLLFEGKSRFSLLFLIILLNYSF